MLTHGGHYGGKNMLLGSYAKKKALVVTKCYRG